MGKLLFLDIDGVLTSRRSKTAFDSWQVWDPVAVQIITNICRDFGAKIVFTSDWRLRPEELNEALRGSSLLHYLHKHSYTPRKFAGRGREVEVWLETYRQGEDYVIIDDCKEHFTGSYLKNLVFTDLDEGLTYKNYLEILEVLKCVSSLVH